MDDSDIIRASIAETLAYHIWLAPRPSSPTWARLALETLIAASLLDRYEVEEYMERYRAVYEQRMQQEGGA